MIQLQIDTRAYAGALQATAAAVRQFARRCRDLVAGMSAEACASAADEAETTAALCDRCADLYSCQSAARACRELAALCRQGPSDAARYQADWCARLCDSCATECESYVQPTQRAAPSDRETRLWPADLAELRTEEEDGRMFLRGIAAPYESLSQDLGGFRERIRRGAFKRALDSGQDVVCVPDHEYRAAHVLGRTGSGTLKLSESDQGLRFRVQLPDTSVGRDLFTIAKRGDIRGMSFAFTLPRPDAEQWSEESGVVVRNLVDLDLWDVSPVVHPAYPATSITVSRRALDHVEQFRRAPARVRNLRRRVELDELA